MDDTKVRTVGLKLTKNQGKCPENVKLSLQWILEMENNEYIDDTTFLKEDTAEAEENWPVFLCNDS